MRSRLNTRILSVPKYIPKPPKHKKGLLISSEPLYLLTFIREADGEEYMMELTQKQIVNLLEEDVKLIHLQASIDAEGNWRKKEVRI